MIIPIQILFSCLLLFHGQQPSQDDALLSAASNGNLTEVKRLLTAGANPNARDKDGNTPLIRCAWWTQYDLVMIGEEERRSSIVDELIGHGAYPNIRGQDGITALMRSAGWQHSLTMKALLKGGADVNLRDNKGRTALTWAARNTYSRKQYIQPLLEKGAKIGVTDALSMGDFKEARDLIQQGGDLSVRGGFEDTPLMIAAEWGDLQTVNALLRRKVDVNALDSKGLTALMIAAAGRPGLGQAGRYWTDHGVKKGRGAVIRSLVRAGAKLEVRSAPEYISDTSLSLAIEAGSTESALALVAAGANPNSHVEIYETPINLAASKNEDAVILALLKAGAGVKPTAHRPCPLGSAASGCKPGTLRAIISAGAPVDQPDMQGITPLMYAISGGKLENVRTLLDSGAQVNSRSKEGYTALIVALDVAPRSGISELLLKRGAKVGLIEALLVGNRSLALKLIRAKADLAVTSYRGFTPLMIACEWGDLELAQALLKRGVRIDGGQRAQGLPIILAACGRDEIVYEKGPDYRYHIDWFDHGKRGKARFPLVQLLLSNGADVSAASKLSETALEQASAKGDVEMMSFLMDKGANPNYAPPKLDSWGTENRTPLLAAAEEGRLEAVKLLVSRGAEVNGGNSGKSGNGDMRKTALLAAVEKDHVEIVRFLLSKGADPSIKGEYGSTVREAAQKRKNSAIMDLFK